MILSQLTIINMYGIKLIWLFGGSMDDKNSLLRSNVDDELTINEVFQCGILNNSNFTTSNY